MMWIVTPRCKERRLGVARVVSDGRRVSVDAREEGRIPRCSRTAGVELKMEPDDPRIMIWVFRAAIVTVVPLVVWKRG